MQAHAIARRANVPEKFLEAILVELRRAGFVQSRRGHLGGHALAKPAAEIMVGDLIRAIDGPLAPVRSPIFLATDQGDEQVILGSTPLLDADAALAALDAAVAAYDNGQGQWPNLRVAERIAHIKRTAQVIP